MVWIDYGKRYLLKVKPRHQIQNCQCFKYKFFTWHFIHCWIQRIALYCSITHVVEGITRGNGVRFFYGVIVVGKTYPMLGTINNLGLMVLINNWLMLQIVTAGLTQCQAYSTKEVCCFTLNIFNNCLYLDRICCNFQPSFVVVGYRIALLR